MSEVFGGKKSLSMFYYIWGVVFKDIFVLLFYSINGKSKLWEFFVVEEFVY